MKDYTVRRVGDNPRGAMWQRIHERLGCEGCKFADAEQLGRGSCCTYPGYAAIEDETGKCLKRRKT